MPIYMIMPRYSHNYSLFYQLLDSNSFTHRNTYAILREATSETYGPRVYFPSYKFPIYFTLQSLLSIYIIKIPKIFILSLLSLSNLTVVSDREGIDNPFIMLVARFLFVCPGTRDLRVVSYWSDTLVHKNWGKYLHYFDASPFPLQGKTNACSRGRSHHPFPRPRVRWLVGRGENFTTPSVYSSSLPSLERLSCCLKYVF